MYEVDSHDIVIKIGDIPQPSVGAPEPTLLGDESVVLLSYYVDEHTKLSVDAEPDHELVAVVRFNGCYAHFHGPPNDEAFHGHPLSARGLKPHSVFEVRESSWLRKLERMNSVHPNHDKQYFLERLHHFIFAFHDSTFECIARGFEVNFQKPTISNTVEHMIDIDNELRFRK